MDNKTIKVIALPKNEIEEIYNYLYSTPQAMANVEKLVNYLRNAKEYDIAYIDNKDKK